MQIKITLFLLVFAKLLLAAGLKQTSAAEPIGWWKFNESSGTTASDSSGFNNYGTLVGGPVWSTGKDANSLLLDGVNDYVTLPGTLVSTLTDF